MSISSELKYLEKAFLALPNEGILPKETILISSIKGLFQQKSSVHLIGHIVSSNFEETLNTLQYIERCKAEVVGNSKFENVENTKGGNTDQLLRNLRQVNDQYKKDMDALERSHENQLEKIKNMLGLKMDLKKMLQKGPSPQDKIDIENFKLADERVRNFEGRNKELQNKAAKSKILVEKIKQKIEDKSGYFGKLLGDLNADYDNLAIELNKIKTIYNSVPEQMNPEIEEERKKKAEMKIVEMEKKFEILFVAQEKIEQSTEEMLQATRVFQNAKRDTEGKYRVEMMKQKETKEEELENLAKQFEYHYTKKSQKVKEFMLQAEKYCKKKEKSLCRSQK